jgi:hypothetical protein
MRPILQAVGAEEASLSTRPKTQHKEDGEYLPQPGSDGKPGGRRRTRWRGSSRNMRRRTVSQARGQARHPPAGDQARLPPRDREAGGRRQRAAGARRVDQSADRQGANPFGQGESKRQAAKHGDVFVSDDPQIADFRVQINENSDDLLDQIFAPRGNQ